jgi:hypothetical protein
MSPIALTFIGFYAACLGVGMSLHVIIIGHGHLGIWLTAILINIGHGLQCWLRLARS